MTELIDSAVIDELRDIMGEEMQVLITTFIQDSEAKFVILDDAIKQQDWETTYRTAHSIKGSSRNLGAVQLAACLEKLEKNARAGKTDGLVELFTIAHQLFERSREQLTTG